MVPRLFVITLLAVAGLFATTKGQATEAVDCTAPAKWFPHAQTPDLTRVNQMNFNNNCDFHQFSWQAFLWLTQTVRNGNLRFENMIPAQAVVEGKRGEKTPGAVVNLLPRSRKTDLGAAFNSVAQASSLGLMVDQNGRAIYYSMYVNDTYFDFVVTENQYNIPANLLKAPATQNYPIGVLTLKAAWKIVAEGEDVSDFYTTKGSIQLLTTNAEGAVVLDMDKTADVTVALVGLHVVGIVNGHPEAIWATFEHRRNAPEFAHNQLVDDPVSTSDFTFYKANTTAGECNQNNAGFLKLTNPQTQSLSPVTQACRQYPFGAGDFENVANIASLNTSVHGQLAPDSVWKNYMEVGAIWFNKPNHLKPNMLMTDNILTGSQKLSNALIETFTQKVKSENNCFACHSTQMVFPSGNPDQPLPGKNLNISHILLNAYVQNLGKQ